MKRLIALFFNLIVFISMLNAQHLAVPDGRPYKYNGAYFFEFNEIRRVPYWVGYTLKAEDVQGDALNHMLYYQDNSIVGCPTPDEYLNSGYAYGQLRSSGDSRSSDSLMRKVNYFTNIAPMDVEMKEGVWRILNNMIRGWAVVFDSVTVISGPIYDSKNPRSFGRNEIYVPDKFFKVVLVYNGLDMGAIGFVIPNWRSANDLKDYSMPVDSVELMTGLDFFASMPDYLEFYLEEQLDPLVWKDQSYSYQYKMAFIEEKRCVAELKKGDRCKLPTKCVTQQCWKHGCDIKAEISDDD